MANPQSVPDCGPGLQSLRSLSQESPAAARLGLRPLYLTASLLQSLNNQFAQYRVQTQAAFRGCLYFLVGESD